MKKIYVDANATYPVAPQHYDQVAAILKEMDGNPSSIHAHGRMAKVALEEARGHLAALLKVRPPELLFTSGATESNNLVIQGVISRCRFRASDVSRAKRGISTYQALSAEILPRFARQDTSLARKRQRLIRRETRGFKPRVLVSAVEHSSVLEPAALFEERGLCDLKLIPVTRQGEVEQSGLLELLSDETVLVAIMHGNNEVGTINAIQELARLVRARCPKAHIHVDAVQTLGKVDLTWIGEGSIDSAAFSAHKIGGFKGVGALYLRSGCRLAMLMAGGGQERGRRPGTENMPGIVSFGLRCAEILKNRDQWVNNLLAQKQAMLAALGKLDGVVIHGCPANADKSLPNTINFHVEKVPGEDILLNFDLAGIAASSGSACSAGVGRSSHVLTAMGYDDWTSLNSIRLSFVETVGSLRSAASDLFLAPDAVSYIAKILRDVIERSRR